MVNDNKHYKGKPYHNHLKNLIYNRRFYTYYTLLSWMACNMQDHKNNSLFGAKRVIDIQVWIKKLEVLN